MVLSKEWDFLTNYESLELVKRDYSARHGRTISAAQAREIASPFIHARSYFRSARDADLTVKPLLLYYGVTSLSRGLTLMLARGKREASLTPSHGITVQSWHESLERRPPDFSDLAMKISKRGTIQEIAEATGNLSLLRGGSSAVNFRYSSPPITPDTIFTLGDLLSREPAIQDHQHRWTGKVNCAPFATEKSGEQGIAHIKILKYGKKYIGRELADRIFAGSPFSFVSEADDSLIYRGPDSLSAVPSMTDLVEGRHFGIGDLWITTPQQQGFKPSKIAALFCMAYGLGMLVRYFPKHWTALIRGQIEDAPLPTILAAVDLIEALYPKVTLDFLNEPRESEKSS